MNFKIMTVSVAIGMLSFSAFVKAEEVNLPVIKMPSILDEGTQRDLTSDQIAELLPWAKNSKIFLVDLLSTVQALPTDQKIERMAEGIKQVVLESAPKNSELVMRYALNRALVINDILTQETNALEVGSNDAKARVLVSSIQLAIKYYDSDLSNLSAQSTLPYAEFGIEYFKFLTELNKSIFDASAQYNIQRTALEFLQWDLYRDLSNTTYASQIVKINTSLKIFPVKTMPDSHSINYVRQMKKTVELLDLKITPIKKEGQSAVELKKRGNYTSIFSTYNGTNFCYNADRDGNRIGESSVSIDYCQEGFISIFSSYSGTSFCYAADYNGKRLGTGSVDISNCQVGYKSFFSSYYGTNFCYPVDKKGEKLGTKTVNIIFCQ